MHGDMEIVAPIIEKYILDQYPSAGKVEEAMRKEAEARGGFPIVGPLVGRLLMQQARLIAARRVYEFGSGFGYSAFWFAQAVGPGGEVVAVDGDAENVSRGKKYMQEAGFADRVKYFHGDALEVIDRHYDDFDVFFFDLDKKDYPKALAKALPKLRKGGLLLADNVLWGGAVARPEDRTPETEGLRAYTRKVMLTPGLVSAIVPLRDGVAITLKLG